MASVPAAPHPLVLRGVFGSPYSLKVRAALRYRRIPFRWAPRGSRWDDVPDGPVPIIPVLAFPDGDGGYADVAVDSTPLLQRLEREVAGRSLVPPDPALAFLDLLVEDYADEWLTKAMYHYRWAYGPDIDKAGKLIPLDADLALDADHHADASSFVVERQIGRRPLVGSTDENAPVIEGSYERLLDLLQAHLGTADFLFGSRPGCGDLGLFGQLSQLVGWDPTPAALAVARAPRVVTWVSRADDLSWWEVDGDGGWLPVEGLPPTVDGVLREIGATYVPFVLANAAALTSGADTVVCEIRSRKYRQAPFRYQGKCLQRLRQAHDDLDAPARAVVGGVLAGTGCEALFA